MSAQQDALFRDRRSAGRQLARELQPYRGEEPIVLGLPRGGVPVAYEVATLLDAPLGVLVVSKVSAPHQPEFGIGAVGPGVTVRYDEAIEESGISEADFERAAARVRQVVADRHRRYNGDDVLPSLRGHTAILVDDGLATGVSAAAAIRAARKLDPDQLVLAVPVGAVQSLAALRDDVDDLVCLHALRAFGAVGQWYEHFEQTTDEEVIELLEEANRTVTDDDLREPG
jgi:predicted phosphoribosyltransferase